MNRYVYPHQCEDCGKRFPRKDQLGRHIRRTHPTERVQCRWCHYSQPATDAYRVRKHELIHQKYLDLEPMATPSYTRGQVESVVQVPDIDDSCRQLMQELDASMPDFADLLGVEPRTPSPMRVLMGIVASPPPEAVVPSDQLFSRYLSPVTSPEGTYSDESEEPVPASVTIISPVRRSRQPDRNTRDQCNQQSQWTDQRTSARPLQQASQYTSDQCGDGHRNHKPDQ
jgi:hypothetical protein